MIHASIPDQTDNPKPILPAWIMDGSAAVTAEHAGFASGSALALLHSVLNDPTLAVPSELLRNSFALSASVQCLKFERNSSGRADLLDAYHLTKPGDERGAGGDMLAFWNKACSIKVGPQGWQDRIVEIVPEHMREYVDGWLDFSSDGSSIRSPVAIAADTLHTVFNLYPREESIAFLLADLRLAHELRWPYVFPFFGQHLKRKHLQGETDELLLDSNLAVATVAQQAVRQAYDLSRRSERLRAVAPKLRAKGADAAVELFLSEVAVTPSSMLSPKIKGTNISMTDRAARRLCDRLVELGAVRELTGRSTFRLYGL